MAAWDTNFIFSCWKYILLEDKIAIPTWPCNILYVFIVALQVVGDRSGFILQYSLSLIVISEELQANIYC